MEIEWQTLIKRETACNLFFIELVPLTLPGATRWPLNHAAKTSVKEVMWANEFFNATYRFVRKYMLFLYQFYGVS